VPHRFSSGGVGDSQTKPACGISHQDAYCAKRPAKSRCYGATPGAAANWHTCCTYEASHWHHSRYNAAFLEQFIMATITIDDLSHSLALDRKAMTAIRGGGAPWVFGWIQPYVRSTPSMGPVVNLYEIQNNFYADQMINQFQTVDVRNSGDNTHIAVTPDARSTNLA
jgi:hypothetical protein